MASLNLRILILLALCSLPHRIHAEEAIITENCEIIIDDFKAGIAPDWSEKSFNGKTHYSVNIEGEQSYLRAISNASASGLYYKIKYDPREYPFIVWKWRVDNILQKGDATKKSGDDYAARIYVVFPSFFLWKTKAINYIWANKLAKNNVVPNPYNANAMMVSVESGSANTGKWITERRNVYLDYQIFFGKEPPKVGAIAIMTDTDDTKEKASASYSIIAICKNDPLKKETIVTPLNKNQTKD
jgi:hypothetical protein